MESTGNGKLVTNIDEVTPQWLTDVLKKSGSLTNGEVTGVRKKFEHMTFGSSFYTLKLTYSDNQTPAPANLFLKISKKGMDVAAFKKEVEFYTTGTKTMGEVKPNVMTCYDAVYCPVSNRAHLLFDHLSKTHFSLLATYPLPPTKQQCCEVMDAFAKFHAFWWERRIPGHGMQEFPSKEAFRQEVAGIKAMFARFVDYMEERLSSHRRKLYEKVLGAAPAALEQRRFDGRKPGPYTLIHGDAHLGNILYPYSPEKDRIRIIDWQSWKTGFAADDMAFMMAYHWFPEQRKSMEMDLLKRYFQKLLEYGVQNYTWDDFRDDYRMSVIKNLFMPIWHWYEGQEPETWYFNLEMAVMAYEDLSCEELL
ncbi:MAG: phosphotransferase [bacterium]|nr:phosphotransferase [bacterium]